MRELWHNRMVRRAPAWLIAMAAALFVGCGPQLSTAQTTVLNLNTCEGERVLLQVASTCQRFGECVIHDDLNYWVDPDGGCAVLPNGIVPAGEDSDWDNATEEDLQNCAALCPAEEGDTGVP